MTLLEQWSAIPDYRKVFEARVDDYCKQNGLRVDIYETNPMGAFKNGFEHWLQMYAEQEGFADPLAALDAYIEKKRGEFLPQPLTRGE